MPEKAVTSFILRFVHEPETENATVEWRGLIRHIQSCEQLHFVRIEDCLRFIDEYVKLDSGGPQAGGDESPLQQPPLGP